MENNEDGSNLEFMSDDEYERLKRIAKENYLKGSGFTYKMIELFEELFKELDEKEDENHNYDGWLNEKDRYKP